MRPIKRMAIGVAAGVLAGILSLVLVPRPSHATTTQITGTIMNPAGGGPLNGTACLALPVNAVDTSTSQALTTQQQCYSIINGQFPSTANVTPNDVIQPQNTYYRTLFYDTTGRQVFAANYVIPTGGGTFNIGVAVPTAILTANISYISPSSLSGNNVFTGLNTFTQQITSSVPNGTSPFVLSSSTVIPNLNASLLQGDTWAIPGTIGSTTPNTGSFTTLGASTANITTVNGGTLNATAAINDAALAASAKIVCTDGSKNLSTTGCHDLNGGTTTSAGTCPTAGTAYAMCSVTVPLFRTEPDANYAASCTVVNAAAGNPVVYEITSKSTTQIVVEIMNQSGALATASTPAETDCTVTR